MLQRDIVDRGIFFILELFEFEKSDEMECSGDNYKVNAIKFLVFPGVTDYKFKDYKNYTE